MELERRDGATSDNPNDNNEDGGDGDGGGMRDGSKPSAGTANTLTGLVERLDRFEREVEDPEMSIFAMNLGQSRQGGIED